MALWLAWLGGSGLVSRAQLRHLAPAPRIELIERFGTNQVIIHFDTEADRVYTLQATSALTFPTAPTGWEDLFVAPNLPFPNHYIVAEERTHPQRAYRLKVTN